MMANRATVLEMLKKVQPAVSIKDNNMQQNHIVFYNNMAIAYNDEVAVCHDLPESLVGIGDFAVPAKELIALLEKLSAEDVDITLDNDKLIVKAGRSKSQFTIQTDIRMPLDEICKWSTNNKKLPKKFKTALYYARIACGRDMTKPLTTCVYFTENTLMATDNYQCARYEFDKKFKWLDSIYLPNASAEIVGRYDDLEQYGIIDGWIQFIDNKNNMTISCRTYYKGQPFADVQKLFAADGERLQIPKKLQPALERAGLFINEGAGSTSEAFVRIDVSENKITVSGSSGVGSYSESMRIEYNGEPKSFYIRDSLLKRVVQDGLECMLCPNFIRIIDDNYDFMSAYIM